MTSESARTRITAPGARSHPKGAMDRFVLQQHDTISLPHHSTRRGDGSQDGGGDLDEEITFGALEMETSAACTPQASLTRPPPGSALARDATQPSTHSLGQPFQPSELHGDLDEGEDLGAIAARAVSAASPVSRTGLMAAASSGLDGLPSSSRAVHGARGPGSRPGGPGPSGDTSRAGYIARQFPAAEAHLHTQDLLHSRQQEGTTAESDPGAGMGTSGLQGDGPAKRRNAAVRVALEVAMGKALRPRQPQPPLELDPIFPMESATLVARNAPIPEGDPRVFTSIIQEGLSRLLTPHGITCKEASVYAINRAQGRGTLKILLNSPPDNFRNMAFVANSSFAFGQLSGQTALLLAGASDTKQFRFRLESSAPAITLQSLQGQAARNGKRAFELAVPAMERASRGFRDDYDPAETVLSWALSGVVHARWSEELRAGSIWHRVLLPDMDRLEILRSRMYGALPGAPLQLNSFDSATARLALNCTRMVSDIYSPYCVTAFDGITQPLASQAQAFLIVPYDSTIYNTLATALAVLVDAGLSPHDLGLRHFSPLTHGDRSYLDLRFHESSPSSEVTHQAVALVSLLASHSLSSGINLAVPRFDEYLRRSPSSKGGAWTDRAAERAACPLCGQELNGRRALTLHMGGCKALQTRFSRCSVCRRSDHPYPLCPAISQSLDHLVLLAQALHLEMERDDGPGPPVRD